MNTGLVIVGGGGHALSIADAAACSGLTVLGCVAPEVAAITGTAVALLGDETRLDDPDLRDMSLINGIGSAGPVAARRHVYQRLIVDGRRFVAVRHPRAAVAELAVTLGNAVQILAGAVIGPGVTLGDNVLINSAATVDHGCSVGDHSHVASGAVVCGDCRIGEAVHIGAGATLIQGIEVGSGAVIAAGAVITRNVEPLTLVAGVPGRRIRAIDE